MKNTIVVLEPSAKSALELLALLEEKGAATIVKVATPDQALQHIVSNLPCILLTSINDNADVPGRIQLFKRLENAIKHHGLKVYVVTPVKNRQLSDLITQKMGVSDYIVEPVPVRTMLFKANLQLKAVDSFRRQQELKKAAEEKVVIKKLDNARKGEVSGTEVKAGSKPAVQAAEDTFLFKNSAVRKAGKKFTIELEGPDPSTGEWVQHEDKGDAQTAWRWVPNDEKEKQDKGDAPKDGWVHKGDKPQFNEESGKWAMSSEKPALSLLNDGRSVAEKIGTDETGEVFVAADSPAAEANLEKNRAKASVERKKREETKKSARELFGGDEKDGADVKEIPAGAGAEKEDPKQPGERKAKPGDGKSAALRSLLGEPAKEDGASAGVLNDKRDPHSDGEPRSVADKRSAASKSLDEIVPDSVSSPDSEENAQEPKGPLAFLQKKKENARAEAARIAAEPALEGESELSSAGEEPAGRSAPRDRRKKAPSGAFERLKNSLAEDSAEEPSVQDPGLSGGEADEESGSEEAPSRAGGPALKAGSGRKAGKAPALREDPAERRAELRDRRTEGAKPGRKGVLDERAQTASKLQALLETPLPDTLPPEEEDSLRAELGLKERPEIRPKELIRKKRLKNVKELKDRLAELQAELDEEEAATGEVHSATSLSTIHEEAIKRKGDLSRDKLKGIRSALDGAEAVAANDEEVRKRLKEKTEELKRKAALKDRAEYMPEAELTPLGNAWEAAGDYYVYLDATVRYKGFTKLENLLPLWIYEGEAVPQLLDKTKQWRFLSRLPFQAKTLAEIPAPVRDFLLGLRDQVLKNEQKEQAGEDSDTAAEADSGATPGSTAKKAAKKAGKVRDLGKGLDELLGGEDDGEAEAVAEAESEAESEAEAEAESVAAAESEAVADSEFESESESELESESKSEPESESAPEADADLEMASETALETPAETAEEAESTSDSPASSEKRPAPKSDRMSELRAKLGMEDAASPEGSAPEKESPASAMEADPPGKTVSDEPQSPQGNLPAASSIAALSNTKSEGIQKFLERRKKKLEEALPKAPPPAPPKAEPSGGFLGIYVAISDAYANVSSAENSLRRILGSVEASFKDCTVLLTGLPDTTGSAAVALRSGIPSAAVEMVALSAGLSEAVRRDHGGPEQILGYLYLQGTGARTGFSEAEEATFRRIVSKIWPLVAQLGRGADAERKAA